MTGKKLRPNKTLSKRISQLLKRIREYYNYSQLELADILGVTQGYISMLEDYKRVSAYKIFDILADFLEISTDLLLLLLIEPPRELRDEDRYDFEEIRKRYDVLFDINKKLKE